LASAGGAVRRRSRWHGRLEECRAPARLDIRVGVLVVPLEPLHAAVGLDLEPDAGCAVHGEGNRGQHLQSGAAARRKGAGPPPPVTASTAGGEQAGGPWLTVSGCCSRYSSTSVELPSASTRSGGMGGLLLPMTAATMRSTTGLSCGQRRARGRALRPRSEMPAVRTRAALCHPPAMPYRPPAASRSWPSRPSVPQACSCGGGSCAAAHRRRVEERVARLPFPKEDVVDAVGDAGQRLGRGHLEGLVGRLALAGVGDGLVDRPDEEDEENSLGE
jgi:hypothetical protein